MSRSNDSYVLLSGSKIDMSQLAAKFTIQIEGPICQDVAK